MIVLTHFFFFPLQKVRAKSTPLHISCQSGQIEVTKLLMSQDKIRTDAQNKVDYLLLLLLLLFAIIICNYYYLNIIIIIYYFILFSDFFFRLGGLPCATPVGRDLLI